MTGRSERVICAAVLLLTWVSHSSALATTTTLNADVTPTKANGDFIAGTGIPSNGFAVDTNSAGQAVALKARLRDTGQALNIIGNRYRVPAGSSALSPSNPAWNFDWQFNPGANGTTSDDLSLEIKFDFDPTVGVADFLVIEQPMFGDPGWDDGDGFFSNPGAGGWSDDNIDYVYSQSWNLGFPTWTGAPFNKTYDENDEGEYEIMLTAKDPSGATLATTNIFVEVVPEPSAIVLFGLGCLGWLIGRRRRG